MKIYILTWTEEYCDEVYPFDNTRGFLTKEKALEAEREYLEKCYDTFIYEVEVEE